ncbi:phosphatidate cytidylyltransferase [Bovifimicola ammoniilytica]|jgi:phosphatidate cytidylyltransferase|uniref:phosphatidate cytidylyltransferase n=1 Tax=Bovifimicola ammoniilytica TaxID=2981720 RepID=UPI00033E6A54|nr:phosphatidate cytidylyltransferase [Bovifimicola ammoniilytica]MCU6753255.1 phosphatidate cytidylyltransferase [Bovifimicola ammoniilytica]CCZ04380.1 phosphatidate cytidylyltransferase [Eubacterium sp. CAG:603]SCJ58074.1 Phosphatidate cytidylyltransferase [uncultured Eubacterium sp.]
MSAIKKLMTKSFLERLISGIILVIIALVTIILGKDVLLVTVVAISVIGFYELAKVYGLQWKLPGICGYIATIGYYALIRMDYKEYIIVFFIAYLIVLMGTYVFTFPKFKAEDVMVCFFGMFYVILMLSYIYQVRMMQDGAYIVWLIFLCSWGCDTCAYLVGVMFGKHKMAPVLSPKKSIEGGIGGVAGAALLGFIYATIFKDKITIDNANIIFPIVCAVGGIISQIGDLTASGIKRNHDIKDYSRLIPGHGGILDRFDSVIITAPIIYYLVAFLTK